MISVSTYVGSIDLCGGVIGGVMHEFLFFFDVSSVLPLSDVLAQVSFFVVVLIALII